MSCKGTTCEGREDGRGGEGREGMGDQREFTLLVISIMS